MTYTDTDLSYVDCRRINLHFNYRSQFVRERIVHLQLLCIQRIKTLSECESSNFLTTTLITIYNWNLTYLLWELEFGKAPNLGYKNDTFLNWIFNN